MAELPAVPTVPPIDQWFKVSKDAGGNVTVQPSDAFYRLIIGERGYSRNVNSGANQARAEAQAAASAAAQAQGTANGAVAGVATLAGQALAFSATVSPSNAFGSDTAPAVLATNSVTVTPVGGTGPYTYSWSITGADIAINSAATASTGFASVGSMTVGEFRSQVATCLVTDTFDASTTEISVGVSLYGEFDETLPP